MSKEVVGFTISSSGNHTVLLNGSFTPNFYHFDFGARTSTTETDIRRSSGHYDQANDFAYAHSITNGSRSIVSETHPILHYQGTTKKIEGDVVSSASGQFVVNYSTVDSAYTTDGWVED